MTSILVAAAAGLVVTLLGTPVAIRLFRTWGWGQRIREAWYGEGPEAHHAHLGKVGTPTMGGIVILVGIAFAYLMARVTGARFSIAGAGVLLAGFGLGLVGFLDDYLKIRKQRSLGVNKIELLTGDHELVASQLATALGISYRAQLLPQDKIRIVREYQAQGKRVVMIGGHDVDATTPVNMRFDKTRCHDIGRGINAISRHWSFHRFRRAATGDGLAVDNNSSR